MEKLNELEALAKQCTSMKVDVNTDAAYANFITQIEPEHIIDIAEHVRELEQRAEAAEAKLADEKQINSKLRDDRAGLSRECNGFEAKLKDQDELIHSLQETVYRYSGPVPAVDLADLVPSEVPRDVYQVIFDECGGFVDCTANATTIWQACRAAMLRKIEEAKK